MENGFHLLAAHSPPGIGNTNLNILVAIVSMDGHLASFGREFTGIVGNGVEHEKCQYAVSLHYRRSSIYLQVDAFQLERHAALLHGVEKLLQGETLNMEAEFALPQLNPLG